MKLNKNNFLHEIHRFLRDDPSNAYEVEKLRIKQKLKFWYQETFQKNNRWNKTQLYKHINDYSNQEIEKLKECYKVLFNTENQYHLVFIRYLQEFQEQREISTSALGSDRLKVDQNTFEEILNYFGELKRDGKIKSTNKQIAKILKLIFNSEKSLKETTIIERLMNKKGYY